MRVIALIVCLFVILKKAELGMIRRSVEIPEDISLTVERILKGMQISIVKRPGESVDFSCINEAQKFVFKRFPSSLMRWKHNGGYIKIDSGRMTMSIQSLTLQLLYPRDSGVYHCQIDTEEGFNIIVAVYTLVVGATGIRVHTHDPLELQCNSAELGHIFTEAKRSWIKKGAVVLRRSARSETPDVFPNAGPHFKGLWICRVSDGGTKRLWNTAVYNITVDPPRSGASKLVRRLSDNKSEVLFAVLSVIFVFYVCIQTVIDRSEQATKGFKKEAPYLKQALGIEESSSEESDSSSDENDGTSGYDKDDTSCDDDNDDDDDENSPLLNAKDEDENKSSTESSTTLTQMDETSTDISKSARKSGTNLRTDRK